MPADPVAPAASGYPAAGYNGGYPASTGNYTAGGCGCNGSYPEVSQYMNEPCNDNQWFGGVYFLYMSRTNPDNVRLTTQIETGTVTYPYYPPASATIVSTQDVDSGFQPGVEVRFGSTFTIGDSCNSCQNSCGYTGCGGCQSCRQPTMYAWEVAWWGIANDSDTFIGLDQANTRIYGMKSFAGVEYDQDGGGGAYAYRPANDYYDYQMPIQTPNMPPTDGEITVLAQRVYTNFQAQNIEVNVIRFPMLCDTCNTGCGGCGGDACGCGGCDSGCGCSDGWNTNFSMYGSCGVRYFRIDDDLSYDTEFTTWTGGTPNHTYDGFSFNDQWELCYDINIDNNLIGPQVGWTSNYCIGCRWNLFCNSTFGIFDNHINQRQRVWTGGDGAVRFTGTGDSTEIRSSKDNVAFLGELRVGGSYDFSCHWRGVLAYRALGLTGIATAVGQMPDNSATVRISPRSIRITRWLFTACRPVLSAGTRISC